MQNPRFSIDTEAAKVFVYNEKESLEIPPLWLRERCQDPEFLDPNTQQRLFNPHLLSEDISIAKVEPKDEESLRVTFNDGVSSHFDLNQIRQELDPQDGLPQRLPWTSDLALDDVTFDWGRVEQERVFHNSLKVFLERGFLLLKNVPTEKEKILDVARQFGHPRMTNFGIYFEVYSRPESNDLAYGHRQLDPHTDNPYREPVPGIQILHCLINEASGGLSTLADSLAAGERLEQEDPEGFELLATTPVRFRFLDNEEELIERRPIIQRNAMGEMIGVNYSPRLDYLNLSDRETMMKFHRARRRLGELLADPQFEKRFALTSGDLILFDNRRLLHGRSEFDPNAGPRHLQGCYIDLDEPKSRYRTLSRQLKRNSL